jgi:hypothetical protein
MRSSSGRAVLCTRRLGLLFALVAVSCARETGAEEEQLEVTGGEAAAVAIGFDVASEPADSLIFAEKIRWAQTQRLDTLELGDAIVALGRSFLGTRYTPGTLEVPGSERLVVNLRELDCVTFIENVLAIVRTLRSGKSDYASFQRELLRIRYRGGVLSGYPSRLHYFSEWIADNEAKGVVRDISAALGGRVDPDSITFMTHHRDAYRQLADTATFIEIARLETTLTGRQRHYIPEGEIDAAASRIRNGDVIAATSTLDGLDVAHTGIAIWVQGRLHLMHAPLVGSAVEISERPLAERIRGIATQDGVMVARPL